MAPTVFCHARSLVACFTTGKDVYGDLFPFIKRLCLGNTLLYHHSSSVPNYVTAISFLSSVCDSDRLLAKVTRQIRMIETHFRITRFSTVSNGLEGNNSSLTLPDCKLLTFRERSLRQSYMHWLAFTGANVRHRMATFRCPLQEPITNLQD